MRHLSLEETFPEQEARLAPLDEPLMSAWAGLIEAPPREAGAALADLLGLLPPLASRLAERVQQLTLLVPRDPDRRTSLRFRSLCVSWRDGGHLLFRGNEHWLPFDWPPDFRGPLARLGLISFHGNDEIFVDAGPEAAAISKRLAESGKEPPADLRPFYTDGGDRTSLWIGSETSRAWVFERSSGRLSLESEGGFQAWFGKRLATAWVE